MAQNTINYLGWVDLDLNDWTNYASDGNKINLSALINIFPNTAEMTYTSVSNTGNTIYNNLLFAWTMTECIEPHSSDGIYSRYKKSFFLPQPQSFTPKKRDTITDLDGRVWTIFGVSSLITYPLYEYSPYLVECVNCKIEDSIKNVVSIYSPQNLIDNMGIKQASNTTTSVATNQACAIQNTTPDFVEPATYQGKHGFKDRFIIYMQNYIPVDYGYVCVDSNGAEYEVVGWSNTQNIVELPEIYCVRRP